VSSSHRLQGPASASAEKHVLKSEHGVDNAPRPAKPAPKPAQHRATSGATSGTTSGTTAPESNKMAPSRNTRQPAGCHGTRLLVIDECVGLWGRSRTSWCKCMSICRSVTTLTGMSSRRSFSIPSGIMMAGEGGNTTEAPVAEGLLEAGPGEASCHK